jgi:hypothetical protein
MNSRPSADKSLTRFLSTRVGFATFATVFCGVGLWVGIAWSVALVAALVRNKSNRFADMMRATNDCRRDEQELNRQRGRVLEAKVQGRVDASRNEPSPPT